MLLNKHRLNAERGLPSPLCTLPMQFDTLPMAVDTVSKPQTVYIGLWLFESCAAG